MNNEKQARAKVRIQRTLKNYQSLLIQAGKPKASDDTELLDQMLVDLHYYCQLQNIDMVDRMTEAAIATEPLVKEKPVVRTAPHPDFVV